MTSSDGRGSWPRRAGLGLALATAVLLAAPTSGAGAGNDCLKKCYACCEKLKGWNDCMDKCKATQPPAKPMPPASRDTAIENCAATMVQLKGGTLREWRDTCKRVRGGQ